MLSNQARTSGRRAAAAKRRRSTPLSDNVAADQDRALLLRVERRSGALTLAEQRDSWLAKLLRKHGVRKHRERAIVCGWLDEAAANDLTPAAAEVVVRLWVRADRALKVAR